MDVLTLRGVLTLDKSEYDRGLDTAEQGARSFGGRFSKIMKVGAAAAVGLGAAAGFAGKKLVDGAKDVAAYGDKVDKMSQKIGISSDAYQKWDYVMQRAGGNVDQLKMGMKTLSQQAEKNSDAFQKLGISQEEVQSLNQEELFERTIKGLSDMEAGTERTALASQLLGRAGADMGPLLNQGSDAIEEQMEIAEKYGMVMPESAVKASAAFEDSMTTMQMTAQGLKNRLLGEFLPAMTQVTDGMAKLFTGDMSGLDDVINGIKGFVDKIGELAPKVLAAGGKLLIQLVKGIIQRLPDMIGAASKLIGKLLEGLTNTMNGSGSTIAEIIQAIVKFFTDNAPLMVQAALSLAIALAQGLIEAIPTIVASIPTIIQGIWDAYMNYDWESLGKNIDAKIGSGIASAAGQAKDNLVQVVDAIRKKTSEMFNALKAKVTAIWNAIKHAITRPIETAKETIRKIIAKIKGFFPISLGKLVSFFLPKISIGSIAKKIGEKLTHAPSFSVGGWTKYAKAMNTPYMLTKPTGIIAGEPGGEVVYGRRSLMNDITKATQNGGKTVNINNYITISGADDPESYMQRFVRSMETQMRTA